MGRRAGLSSEEIIDCAVALADREGLDNLTLAAVASELGIQSPSLYNHIEGVDGLHRALAMRAAEQLRSAFAQISTGSDPEQRFRELAGAYRDFAHEHPGLFSALLRAQRLTEDEEVWTAAAATIEHLAEVIGHMGYGEEDIFINRRIVRAAISGFIDLELSQGFALPLDMDAVFSRLVDVILAGLRELSPQ